MRSTSPNWAFAQFVSNVGLGKELFFLAGRQHVGGDSREEQQQQCQTGDQSQPELGVSVSRSAGEDLARPLLAVLGVGNAHSSDPRIALGPRALDRVNHSVNPSRFNFLRVPPGRIGR